MNCVIHYFCMQSGSDDQVCHYFWRYDFPIVSIYIQNTQTVSSSLSFESSASGSVLWRIKEESSWSFGASGFLANWDSNWWKWASNNCPISWGQGWKCLLNKALSLKRCQIWQLSLCKMLPQVAFPDRLSQGLSSDMATPSIHIWR